MSVIVVGTANRGKLAAVKAALSAYRSNVKTIVGDEIPNIKEFLDDVKHNGTENYIVGFNVESGEPNQPLTEESCQRGCQTRQRNAKSKYPNCDYSLGIESGVYKNEFLNEVFETTWTCLRHTKTGKKFYASSNHWQVSLEVNKMLYQHEVTKETPKDFNEIAHELKMTTEREIGKRGGIVSLVTDGRITREDYMTQALIFLFKDL